MRKSGRHVLAAALLAVLGLPLGARATIVFNYGLCNPSDGCDQSVNFTPANSGITVTGDTNPPAPLYDVFAESLEGLTLHGSGSTVDTGVGGPGFTSLLIYPEAGYGWGAFDFQLDSLDKTVTTGELGLTLTAIDQHGNSFVFSDLQFPWEGNNGENQHYTLRGTLGEFITSVQIDYTDPDAARGNTIQDIHNIDVNTVLVPEPAALALLGIGLVGLGLRRRSTRSR